jgi:hypothetical protein
MSPPVKPQVCVIDGKLNVFMGADYKMLDKVSAKAFMQAVQRGYAQLCREEKQRERARRDG